MRLTFRANFAYRSCCTINGLRNLDYYAHYGYWNNDGHSELTDTVSITPRLIAVLIQYARNSGWSPETSPSNKHFDVTNLDAKSLLNEGNPAVEAVSEKRADGQG